MYGPYTNYGMGTSRGVITSVKLTYPLFQIVATAINVAAVYGYMQKPMKSLWSPGKNANNTVHVDDVAGAAWAVSNWIAGIGRKAANDAAGVPIHFSNDKSFVKEHSDIPTASVKPVAPLFNLASDM